MLTYGEKNYADKMQTTWEKAVQHIGIYLGQYISTEFRTRIIMVIPEEVHSQDVLGIHSCKVQLRNTNHARMREAMNKVLELLAADAAINNLDDVLKTAELQN